MVKIKKYLSYFILIWFKPKKVILEVVNTQQSWVNSILVILGITSFLLYLSIKTITSSSSLSIIISRCLVAGVVLSPIILYLGSLLICWIGKLFGGQATTHNIRTVISWSQVPIASMLILWPIAVALFGKDIFIKTTPPDSALFDHTNLFTGFILIQVLAWFWSIAIFIISLGQVQKISTWKAIINTILFIIILAAFAIGAFLIVIIN